MRIDSAASQDYLGLSWPAVSAPHPSWLLVSGRQLGVFDSGHVFVSPPPHTPLPLHACARVVLSEKWGLGHVDKNAPPLGGAFLFHVWAPGPPPMVGAPLARRPTLEGLRPGGVRWIP